MERYWTYKNSGVEWIGEIPEGWSVKKLKYVVSKIGSGVTPKGGANVYQLRGVPLLRSQNIHFDGLKMDDVAYIDEDVHESMVNSKVQPGDVLLNITGASIGRCFYADDKLGEANVNQHVCIVRPTSEIATSYLYFFFRSNVGQKQIDVEQTGSGREGLNFEALNNFLIPYIPFTEQTAIANYLDRKTAEIDALIAQKERLITLYEEEKTAIINQAVTKGIDSNVGVPLVGTPNNGTEQGNHKGLPLRDSGIDWLGEIPEGWKVKKLKYLIKSIIGGGTPSTANSLFWNGNIPWVSAKDMKQDEIISSEDYITELAIKESSTNYLIENHIIIVVRSGILKHTFPVAINKVPICINQDLKAIKPIKSISVDFFFWMLKGNSKEILNSCNKMGATVDSIELYDLLNFEFSIPSPEEQTIIVHHIETETARIDAKIAKTQRIIELQKEYRTALISEVVTGKIKVTSWRNQP